MGWPIRKNDAAGAELQFPIYDADGDLVSGAASLDSEISKDHGTFADCTNEATEIATSSGIYYLTLTQTEINADIVATITKTGTAGAKTAVNVVYTSTRNIDDLAYPATSGRSIQVETDGHVHADLKEWLGVAPLALATQRVQVEVDAYDAALDFNATQKASINTEADTALVDYDALVPADAPTNWGSMGIEVDGHVHGDVKEWLGVAPNALQSGRVDSYVGAMAAAVITATAIATGAIDADALAADAVTEIRSYATGTSDAGGSTTTVVDAERTEAADVHIGNWIMFTSGAVANQVRLITDFDAATDTITFAPAATGSIGSGITYELLPNGAVDVQSWVGTATALQAPNALQSGRVDSYVGAMAAAVIAAATFASGAIDAAAIGTGAIDADSIAADAITAAKIATDAIGSDELAATAANEIADAVLVRDVDNVEGTAAIHTLCGAILKSVSKIEDDAGTLKWYQTNGTTLFASQTIAVNAAADPIDSLTVAV